ncbi:hypothetical protein BDN70DRAFT_895544 [Pholiota conissans]|uniref:Uncharacterized protein n=1 Tax=Pholiota conissans TaxID=109636 RepID=A0A9P5Z042_9AGAR|nr:hypothetical protein BDN70DRAFT_895544 [Pholiota conissans]
MSADYNRLGYTSTEANKALRTTSVKAALELDTQCCANSWQEERYSVQLSSFYILRCVKHEFSLQKWAIPIVPWVPCAIFEEAGSLARGIATLLAESGLFNLERESTKRHSKEEDGSEFLVLQRDHQDIRTGSLDTLQRLQNSRQFTGFPVIMNSAVQLLLFLSRRLVSGYEHWSKICMEGTPITEDGTPPLVTEGLGPYPKPLGAFGRF